MELAQTEAGLLLLLPAPYPDHAGPYHAGVAALSAREIC